MNYCVKLKKFNIPKGYQEDSNCRTPEVWCDSYYPPAICHRTTRPISDKKNHPNLRIKQESKFQIRSQSKVSLNTSSPNYSSINYWHSRWKSMRKQGTAKKTKKTADLHRFRNDLLKLAFELFIFRQLDSTCVHTNIFSLIEKWCNSFFAEKKSNIKITLTGSNVRNCERN